MKTKNKTSTNKIETKKVDTEKREKRKEPKKYSSLASRISAFYTNMFATWISISLVVIFILVLVFNIYALVSEIKPYLDSIESTGEPDYLIERVNAIDRGRFVLINEQGQPIASTFEQLTYFNNPRIAGFGIIEGKVFFYISKDYALNNGKVYRLISFNDITLLLIEIGLIVAVAIVLFLVSVITIYVRGNYLTRKAFGVLDELIVKANNISSQNLNLRLNVTDSEDELVEFALTFNSMMDRIETAYEKQNQFVSDASHELRTPIAVIQGYARMLERWGKDDKEILQESITAINKEAKTMQDLVDKLLFIARNDKDTLTLVKKTFDMSELMHELIRDTRMIGTNHRIISSVAPGVMLFGDRDRIKQALRIFVDNALKYTEQGKTINLRLEVEDKYAVAIIKDSGIGIPQKDLPNIFDRFYRVDSARAREKGGHGLGLSIARIIVLRHNGRIKVASKLGEGTRFRIFLPMEQPNTSKNE